VFSGGRIIKAAHKFCSGRIAWHGRVASFVEAWIETGATASTIEIGTKVASFAEAWIEIPASMLAGS
jgi:hypothetical protein